jgi:hypothetical protein
MMGATSFSVATGAAVGECFGFGFGVADCSGAVVADCSGAGVGLFGSEIGAGDRCAESNNMLPIKAKRVMGFIIQKLSSKNDKVHEIFLRVRLTETIDLAARSNHFRTNVPVTL